MYGEIQITVKKSECSNSLFELAKEIKEHSSIGVRGKVRPQEKVPNGAEIVPIEIRVFSIAKKAAPFLVQSRTSTVGIDTRLDLRAVDLTAQLSWIDISHTSDRTQFCPGIPLRTEIH